MERIEAAESSAKITWWRRVPVELVLASHLVVAIAVLVLAPRGFPLLHPRFGLLLAGPLIAILLCAGALTALASGKPRIASAIACLIGSAWIGGSATAGWLFPASLAGRWQFGMVAGIAILGTIVLACGPRRLWRALPMALVGVSLGTLTASVLQSPDPTTHPTEHSQPPNWPGDPDLLARFRGGTLRGGHGEVAFDYSPLLTFDRVSPDRFLSLLAPAQPILPLGTVEAGAVRFANGATLRASRSGTDGGFRVAARAPLEADTYSHLNSYAQLAVRGIDEPRLRFSPCAEESIEVRHADYPTGRPARFACLLPEKQFTAFEATSGEKGPFKTLASGGLARSEALTIWIADGQTDLLKWTLKDWSAQASTDLSPTAGWRIPQNAIEFQRVEPDGHLEIWVTLAATSVGRGWDTVGHRAGVYTNTSSIEPLGPLGEDFTETD